MATVESLAEIGTQQFTVTLRGQVRVAVRALIEKDSAFVAEVATVIEDDVSLADVDALRHAVEARMARSALTSAERGIFDAASNTPGALARLVLSTFERAGQHAAEMASVARTASDGATASIAVRVRAARELLARLDATPEVPDALPVFALREGAALPALTFVIAVGRVAGRCLFQDLWAQHRRAFVVAVQRERALESPELPDFFEIATFAMVSGVTRPRGGIDAFDGPVKKRRRRRFEGPCSAIVRPRARVRLVAAVQTEPYVVAQVEYFSDRSPGPSAEDVNRLRAGVQSPVVGALEKELVTLFAYDAGLFADAAVDVVRLWLTPADETDMLSTLDVGSRVQKAITLLEKANANFATTGRQRDAPSRVS